MLAVAPKLQEPRSEPFQKFARYQRLLATQEGSLQATGKFHVRELWVLVNIFQNDRQTRPCTSSSHLERGPQSEEEHMAKTSHHSPSNPHFQSDRKWTKHSQPFLSTPRIEWGDKSRLQVRPLNPTWENNYLAPPRTTNFHGGLFA